MAEENLYLKAIFHTIKEHFSHMYCSRIHSKPPGG